VPEANSVKTQEQFFSVLEGEMRKIDNFTKKMVLHIRTTLSKIEKELKKDLSDQRKEQLQAEVRPCRVNVFNFMLK
jgi:hypothetical protein